MTAAHCFNTIPKQNPDETVKVVLGEFDTENDEGQEVLIDVGKVIKHEAYDPSTMDFDIALVKLKVPLEEFNTFMKPICLPGKTI